MVFYAPSISSIFLVLMLSHQSKARRRARRCEDEDNGNGGRNNSRGVTFSIAQCNIGGHSRGVVLVVAWQQQGQVVLVLRRCFKSVTIKVRRMGGR
jgi:hypothetical protein